MFSSKTNNSNNEHNIIPNVDDLITPPVIINAHDQLNVDVGFKSFLLNITFDFINFTQQNIQNIGEQIALWTGSGVSYKLMDQRPEANINANNGTTVATPSKPVQPPTSPPVEKKDTKPVPPVVKGGFSPAPSPTKPPTKIEKRI
eukprot:UN00369